MQNVSSQMSAARLVLRLLDDLPMLKYTIEYGFGEEENDTLMASFGVITNVIDQLYYPIEKVAWLAEHKLISGVNVEPWDIASSLFWSTSIYLTLMKTLRYVLILQRSKTCIDITKDKQIGLEKLVVRQRYEILTCIRMTLDFIHAVNTLPSGFLWSSKLKTWHVGFIATLSSCIGLYQLFTKKYLK
ncbi:hypothetical protein AMK59_1744 [Oryctes borbonicus]|uniref:Peroxisomal biogenesis factor 11 n=1 Tax=Oryctes borbonicus TaxID=1629725 RepID=A0A0T6BBS4_9SCAR|nr:hypothetical protein AMK59_1744 [Oryctes borbonicus]